MTLNLDASQAREIKKGRAQVLKCSVCGTESYFGAMNLISLAMSGSKPICSYECNVKAGQIKPKENEVSEWKNEILQERQVSDKVKWVLQKSTSPEGVVLYGLRKFVQTKNGEKPTGSGLSLKDLEELKIIKDLVECALVLKTENYFIKVEDRVYVKGLKAGKLLTTKSKDERKLWATKDDAKAFRTKYGDDAWLVLKARD